MAKLIGIFGGKEVSGGEGRKQNGEGEGHAVSIPLKIIIQRKTRRAQKGVELFTLALWTRRRVLKWWGGTGVAARLGGEPNLIPTMTIHRR